MESDKADNSPASEPEAGVSEIADIETLQKSLGEERTKSARYLANWQRAQADLTNYKRLAEQEKEEMGKFGCSVILSGILPILDDLERALHSIPPELDNHACIEGIRLIDRKFHSTLERQGLVVIEALGKPFDPNFHEATKEGKGKDGIVIEELEKGYIFRDRVIRPSKVIVGNGEDGTTAEEGKT